MAKVFLDTDLEICEQVLGAVFLSVLNLAILLYGLEGPSFLKHTVLDTLCKLTSYCIYAHLIVYM